MQEGKRGGGLGAGYIEYTNRQTDRHCAKAEETIEQLNSSSCMTLNSINDLFTCAYLS